MQKLVYHMPSGQISISCQGCMLREAIVINHKVYLGKISQQGGGSKKIKKIVQVREGGGSQNLGTVPKLYLVTNYDGFP